MVMSLIFLHAVFILDRLAMVIVEVAEWCHLVVAVVNKWLRGHLLICIWVRVAINVHVRIITSCS